MHAPFSLLVHQSIRFMQNIEIFSSLIAFQVIAFICGNIVIVLLIMALASTDWLMSTGWRQGLFSHCIEDLVEPIPFNFDAKETGCYPSRDVCKCAKNANEMRQRSDALRVKVNQKGVVRHGGWS